MKKITIICLLLMLISPSVRAGEWLYYFVVFNGTVYEVKQENLIDQHKIGKQIGEVKTQPYSEWHTSAMRYTGDASNIYPIGTPYYKIKGVPTSISIAVKVDNHWVKAVNVEKAPFHVMNTITNLFIFSPIVIISVIVGIGLILYGYFYRVKKRRQN